jgi:2-methylcitrate dehydratase PrpD
MKNSIPLRDGVVAVWSTLGRMYDVFDTYSDDHWCGSADTLEGALAIADRWMAL